jgi:hypothetical protein
MEYFTVVYSPKFHEHFYYINLDKDKFGDLNNTIGHICVSTRNEILSTSGSFIVSPTEKDYDVYMYFIRDAIMEKQNAIEASIKRFQYKYPTLYGQQKELEKQLVIIQTFKDKIPKLFFTGQGTC